MKMNTETYLVDSPSPDYRVQDVLRYLQKAGGATAERKRTVGNHYMQIRGGRTPRQGVLSVELLRAMYQRSDLIFTCINTLIQFVLSAGWTIRAKDEDRSAWLKKNKLEEYLEQQKRIQWLKGFFESPSRFQDYDAFNRMLLRDLLIYDAASYEIVWADFDNGRLPIELGVIAGDTVEIETDEHGLPVSYWQSYNVVSQQQFEDDAIAYGMLNPCSWQPYGMSPLEVAFVQITSDLSANQYNADVFAKNNIPPGILAVMGVSEAEFQRVLSRLRATAADNPHNIHAVQAQRSEDGAKKLFEYVPLQNQTNRDMQYKELLDTCVSRICMVYGVTPSQIGFTEGVTGGIGSGVAETQVDLTQNKGVAPILRMLSSMHTRNVIEPIGWSDLEFAFTQDNTPQREKERENDRSDMQTGALTINEYRAKQGLKAVDWGDLPLTAPQGWQPPMSPEQMQQQMMQQGMGGGMPPQDDAMPMQKSGDTKRIVIRI